MGTSASPSLFVNPQKVVDRMQINSELAGVIDSVGSALYGAQIHVEAVMECELQARTWDVRYWLDSQAFSSIHPNGCYQLELPSAFILSTPAPQVFSGALWNGTDEVQVPAGDYRIDYQRGLMTIDAQNYGDKYIHVLCSSGFTPGQPLATPVVPYPTIPDWLEESIVSYTAVIFDTTQTTNRNAQAAEIYKRSGDHAMACLSPYLRKRGLMFRAISGL